MPADPVRAAIYTRLAEDAELGELLSAPSEFHHEKAPQDSEGPPYVIFNHQGGTEQYVFGPSHGQKVWLVKGVCGGSSATPAEEIDARCRALLHRTKLEVPGGRLTLLRESDVAYGEDPDGERFFHRGGLYRVHIPPTT